MIFLGGFRSDMTGIKATTLEGWAQGVGLSYVRFDFQGHGASDTPWESCRIGLWRDDALAVIDRVAPPGPVILVGSSMGGWIATLAALARPGRVAGLLTIAAAPDFTERLIWDRLDPQQRETMRRDGRLLQPSAYDPDGYTISLGLVEEGRDHLLLGRPIPFTGPVRLLHGQADRDVPWRFSLDLTRDLESPDVRLTLVKDGDHRLSRPQDLALITRELAELVARVTGGPVSRR